MVAQTLLGVFVAAGCSSTTSHHLPDLSPEAAERAIAAVRALSPEVATLIHKVSVTTPVGDLVLTGQLVVDPHRGLRAVAVDEVGGKLFDATICHEGEMIHESPPRFPLRLLRQGPVEDLRALFLVPEDPPEVLRAGEAAALVIWRKGRTDLVYVVDGNRVISLSESRGGRILREARFEYGEEPTATHPLSIELVNHRLGYRFDARLLSRRAAPDPAALESLIACGAGE